MWNRFINNDFPDSILYLLEQALGKAACKRNWNTTLIDAKIWTTTQAYCYSFKDSLNASFSRIPIGNWNRNGYRARNNSSNFTIMQWEQ